MSAYQQRYTPPVRFPVRLSASTTTVLSMFERLMLPNGLIYVDVAVNLTFSAGNQVRAAPPEQTSTPARATCFGSPPVHGPQPTPSDRALAPAQVYTMPHYDTGVEVSLHL